MKLSIFLPLVHAAGAFFSGKQAFPGFLNMYKFWNMRVLDVLCVCTIHRGGQRPTERRVWGALAPQLGAG